MPDVQQWYIPQYLTGEDLSYVSAYVANRNPDGSWAGVGGTLWLTHTLDRIEVTEIVEHGDVRPVNRKVINNVVTGQGYGINMVELLKSDISYGNVLPYMAVAGYYFRVIFAAGWDFWDMYVLRGGIRYGVTDHGRNTCELPFVPFDMGFPSNGMFGFQSSQPPVGS